MTKVSIGLPVYNAAEFLEEALASLVQQTHSDLEILISDNASTDATQEICLRYATNDSRITYVRQETNRGGAFNHTFVAGLATGSYFRWFGADDIMAPTCIEACVRALEHNADAVVAWPHPVVFDEAGRLTEYTTEPPWDDSTPARRLSSLLNPRDRESLLHVCYPIYGLARTVAFQESMPLGAFYGSDRVVLVNLALRGGFTPVGGELMFLRRHRGSSTFEKSSHEVARWMDPSLSPGRSMPTWRLWWGFLDAVRRAPLRSGERARCSASVLRWPLIWGHWRFFVWDLRVLTAEVLQLRSSRRHSASSRRRPVPEA